MMSFRSPKPPIVSLLTIIFLTACAAAAAQSFTHVLSFQGRLADPDTGKPLPDGQYEVTFTIYDADAEGNALWQEAQPVDQVGGVFSAYLGSVTPFSDDLFSGGDRWLGIRVGADAEMPDRFRFTPAPWAIYAAESPPDDDWEVSGDDIQRLTGNVGIGCAASADSRLSVASESPGAARFSVAGEGSAGLFAVTNPQNTDPAVLVDSGGDAPAVKVLMGGTGAAGEYATTNAANDEPVLYAHTVGYGPAGVFAVDRTGAEINTLVAGNKADGAAIYGVNSGHGQSAWFFTTGFDNPKPALQVDNNGTGAAIEAGSSGEGGAGRFTNWDWTTLNPALAAETRGMGSAGKFTNTNLDNTSPALVAQNDGLGEAGVFVNANDTNGGPALYAESYGVSAQTRVISGRYVGATADAAGVYGESVPADFYGTGGAFVGGYVGAAGVVKPTGAESYMGLYGSVSGGTGTNMGVYGYADGFGTNYAGYFTGDVKVTGYLFKDGGGFQIDHPLDPANMYLNHSFVESPDMKNVYDGVELLDGSGEAWVELPEWFGALNGDFRYQLTAIGAPGPSLYIAEEVAGNRFKIAGGEPGMKVSWLVTGIRQDPYAEAHRIPVEERKPPHVLGLYEHPELYGRPESDGVNYAARAKAERAEPPGETAEWNPLR
jgi:hypothetical protein